MTGPAGVGGTRHLAAPRPRGYNLHVSIITQFDNITSPFFLAFSIMV